MAIATFDEAASELRFDSTVTLEHIETALPDYALEVGAHTYPFRYSDDERPDLVSALARQYPSDDLGPWTARFLTSSGSTTTMTLLHSMTRGIKEEFDVSAAESRRVSRARARRCGAAAAAAGTSRCS